MLAGHRTSSNRPVTGTHLPPLRAKFPQGVRNSPNSLRASAAGHRQYRFGVLTAPWVACHPPDRGQRRGEVAVTFHTAPSSAEHLPALIQVPVIHIKVQLTVVRGVSR